ncbi:MAG: hypothetical protein R3C58_07145 [Parvularculaceae bacterium]
MKSARPKSASLWRRRCRAEQMRSPQYIHLKADENLPSMPLNGAFSAVVIIECDITAKWRALVSRWLVRNGCLFMMAWGRECALWDESVDYANIDQFGGKVIPEENYVYTTWHDDEELEEVFWFSRYAAQHPVAKLENILLVDISPVARERKMIDAFESAIRDQ